jgi:hypothetical protein
VSSVNGDSSAGACGTAGATGSFAVRGWQAAVTTVDVTTTTTFAGSLLAPPTFAHVCVGKLVGAIGAVSDGTVSAAKVFVIRAATAPTEQGAFGTVTSVNGVSTSGTCGAAGSTGSFMVSSWKSAGSTVEVTATTAFNDPAASPPSFADVCVGSLVGAVGTVTGDTVTAAKVCVVPTPTTPVPSGTSAPVAPATGPSNGPALATDPQAGSGGPGAPVVGQDPSPAAPHGFGPSAFGSPAFGPSARWGGGAPGGSDPHGGEGGHSGDGNNQFAPSGGFSGPGHGRG